MEYQSFSGIVMMIDDFSTSKDNGAGCYKMFMVDNGYGNIVNFIIEPTTYFVDHAVVKIGDQVTGFYDANAPAPLIYPPQFRALVMSRDSPHQNVKVDYFNRRLESSDGTLRLNLSSQTQITLQNGQPFNGDIGGRNLIVVYGSSTRSIPAQTTPTKIIVLCP
ncbi:hypothetical protein HMPREF9372_2613 [Sporosarcina newyorkensis 2681]|uniref:Uncharacterized protein n=2 Tax=Sporosarcina newyorkensis TaxID=759851 RepID=F9DUY2_9BACL|nr:hypothetical protein HMPREF9372_2613 [Sporosarcina newyorkensis 2681]